MRADCYSAPVRPLTTIAMSMITTPIRGEVIVHRN